MPLFPGFRHPQEAFVAEEFFDHIIGNDADLQENLDYIAMKPVTAGYVSRPQFYPYRGFLY